MQETKTIWFNGKFIPWKDANVHVLTHTLHYGGGAFEGIRFYATPKGPAIFRLADHVDRLFYSANALNMQLPFSRAEITAAITEVARINELKQGYIRPIVFYGYGKMGVNPEGAPVEVAIACWPWGAYLPHDSVDIKTSSYIRIHPRSTIADAKLCGHYLNGILASIELQGTHYHEALFLDANDHIAEGVGENFFMIKDNTVYTPKLGSILAGITRSTIIEIAQKLGYPVIEADLKLTDAYKADEAFFTGTAAEVTPIRSIDDQVLGNISENNITHKIKTSYHDIVSGRNPEFLPYLTLI